MSEQTRYENSYKWRFVFFYLKASQYFCYENYIIGVFAAIATITQ